MRVVDMATHSVVCRGLPWPEGEALPSTREMLCKLERNEAFITWLQPSGGKVDEQLPAIQIGGNYYTISLRMMKAVWRHVRLKKGFVNREVMPHVGTRLRIPTLLLSEKIRTQLRFNVMRTKAPAMGCVEHIAEPYAVSDSRRCNFKDMLWVVQACIVPAEPPGEFTAFKLEEAEIFDNLLYQMRRDCPSMTASDDAIFRAIASRKAVDA